LTFTRQRIRWIARSFMMVPQCVTDQVRSLLRHFGRARGLSYRWFFVTAPFAFFDWLEGLLMIVFWLFAGFAP
jgi:hypothetical protein